MVGIESDWNRQGSIRMKNINLEKDIVNAKENSIETFGVILGWFAAISLQGASERSIQEQIGAEDIKLLNMKEHLNEQDDFYQTILVPAINNAYINLDALIRKSIYKDPITGNNFEISAMLKKQYLGAIVMPKKTLGRSCYNGGATFSDSNYFLNVVTFLEDLAIKNYNKSQSAPLSEDDSELYAIASEEVEGDKRIEALWTKCIVLNKGDESLAKYEYIAKRVELLSTEKAKEMINLSSTLEFADILKSLDQILRKFTSPILQALVTSIGSMTLFSKEDGGSDLENNFLERINEIYSPTEDILEFAVSIMGIEGSIVKSADGNFKYYFLDGDNNYNHRNENSITCKSRRKIYRERRDELTKSITFLEYEKTLIEDPNWTNSYSNEELESIKKQRLKQEMKDTEEQRLKQEMKDAKRHLGIDGWSITKKIGAGILGVIAASIAGGAAGNALGQKLGQTTYSSKKTKLGRPFESEDERKWRQKERFINRNKKFK